MQSGFVRLAFSLACFLFVATWPTVVLAHSGHMGEEAEHIEQFDVILEIGKNGTVDVSETIRYNSGGAEKHGIYRDIPIKYVTSIGTREALSIDVLGVEDAVGNHLTHEESQSSGNWRIQIGAADRLVSGTLTYVIRYRVDGALSFYDDFDELYWNATGHDWTVPIYATSVTVRTVGSTTGWRFACYIGPRGSTERCDHGLDGAGAMDRSEIRVDVPRVLLPGSGITVALGFDKGYATEPTWWERVFVFIGNNPLVMLPVVVTAFMGHHWYLRGRDPKGRAVIVPEYEVPEQLSPLELAGLENGKVSSVDISAAIIDLAIQGYVRIEKAVEDRLFLDKTDYTLYRLEKTALAGSLEATLLADLFTASTTVAARESAKRFLASPVAKVLPKFIMEKMTAQTMVNESEGKTVKISDLKNKFYANIPSLQEKVMNLLVQKGWYTENPQTVRGKYILIGAAAIPLVFILGFVESSITVLSVGLAGVIYFFFSYLMPRMTKTGVLVRERLLGLKEYLQIAEKRRLEFHNAPEKTPELFERLLPAALILGVSDIWAKEFADIYMRPPEWYSGTNGASFTASAFASDMNSFSSAASASLASSPSSSGSGGGGSSGGGRGGGGGGSW